jgi:outer membrane protein assembly factor BamB
MTQRLVILGLAVVLLTGAALAGDSPQFRGPNRDGIYSEQGLLKTWPEGGPAVAWVAKGIGNGYSSIAVAGDKIYASGMGADETGFVSVLSLDGKVEKTIPYGKETTNDQAPGPRSTPTLDGKHLYIMSGLGVVYCIDLDKGGVLWNVDVLKKFGGENNTWTLAESLLVDGDRVICKPGGVEGGIVALNKLTGETVWAAKGIEDKASYCSPAIVTHNGHRILLTETETLVVGVNPDNGALLWTHPHKTEYNIHAVTPIYSNGLVYYSGGYGSGGGALELSPDGAAVTLKWEDKKLDCQHHGVVLVDGYLYGTGHKTNQLVCLEMATGKVMWQSKEVKQGNVIYADGMLYVYEGPKSGLVGLVKVSPEGMELAGRFTVTEGNDKHWAHPVIAGGRLYIRHGDALIAYTIASK